jgi:hypothetical protein
MAEIIDRTILKKENFGLLEIGTYFKLYGRLYVKINYSDEDDNVFDLKAKHLDTLEANDEVEIVDVDFIVKNPQ